MRKATVSGDAGLTLELRLDGAGRGGVTSGAAYFDHLIRLLAANAGIDIAVATRGGPAFVSQTVAAVGHCLGQALTAALGDKRGIARYASAVIPVEASLVRAALDLSGRPHLEWSVALPESRVEDFSPRLVPEFMRRFIVAGGVNMHVELLEPGLPHHALEAIFIAVGRALGEATSLDGREKGIPSSKGVL